MIKMVLHKRNVNEILRYVYLFVVALFFIGITMYRGAVTTYADDNKTYVTDSAGILQSDEIDKLEKLCKIASENCQTDIFIVTLTDGLEDLELDTYLRNMMNTAGYGYNDTYDTSSPDAIGFAIDMTSRKYRISSSGNSMSDIPQSDMDDMVDSVQSYLADGDYYKACTKFVKAVEGSMNTSISYQLSQNITTNLLVAVVVATVVVVIMMFNTKSKVTVDSRTYTKDHGFKVNAKRDVFINTTVTARHIERHDSSSSDSGDSSSSGGNSGGGGGSF